MRSSSRRPAPGRETTPARARKTAVRLNPDLDRRCVEAIPRALRGPALERAIEPITTSIAGARRARTEMNISPFILISKPLFGISKGTFTGWGIPR